MSFVFPQPCTTTADGDCCPSTFTGFCLEDGTPIGIVVQEDEQIGWFNFTTAVFTPGPPPVGTGPCPQNIRPLDCATDFVTICPPVSGFFEVASAPLTCATDSVTTCPQAAATAATLSTAIIPVGVAIVTRPGDWAITDAPASGVRATTFKVAAVGTRHIATAISFSVITTTTAPATATLTITLRDGASGLGTVLMSWRVRIAAAMTDINVAQVVLGGLNVIGSANTAMTLEFDSGNINTLEDVSLTGYSVV